MAIDSAIPAYPFATPTAPPLTATFDAARATSDGGLPWLAEADDALGLTAALAACIPDWRTRCGRHGLAALVRQRVLQIACGYADQDDADTLRHDPLFRWACGQPPEGGPLASQPTLSRLENAADRRACYRLALALADLYIRERARDGVPARILLDLDSTADPAHGRQEGSAYHGYYRQRMLHPLLLFDGDTGQLVAAVLRPGTAHASRGAVAVLKRLLPRLRLQWPGVAVELRADSGFASPALYAFCEAEGLEYTIGLVPNPTLTALAAPLLAEAELQQRASADPAAEKVRLAGEARYQAGSWARERRVVYKAEALPQGPNTRFVVTTRTAAPLAVYDWYVGRGAAENRIKDFKRACAADRLSCHRFLANQCRLLLHAAAYWLLDTLRRRLARAGHPPLQLDTLRLLTLKVGGFVRGTARHWRLHLASGHPGQPLWALLATQRHPRE